MDECSIEKEVDDPAVEAECPMGEAEHSEVLDEFVNTYRCVSVMITLDRKYPHERFHKIEQVVYNLTNRATNEEIADPDFPFVLMTKASEEMGYISDSNIEDDSKEYYRAISSLLGRPEYDILMSNVYSKCDTSDEDVIKKVEGALLKIYREMAIEDFYDPNVLEILEYRIDELLQNGENNSANKFSNSI